jgi:hypothetical protein
MQLIEQLLSKYKFSKRNKKPQAILEEIEDVVHFKLPVDYLPYALNYSGFDEFIGNEFVRLWDFDELIQTNTDYQIFNHLPKTLGIGGNGSSEFIAIGQTENGSMRVVLSPFVDLDTQYHIEIGKSFTDFLKRLDDGEAWFK